jgi:ACS family sodium-dependent inorganic phosphate cotransporter
MAGDFRWSHAIAGMVLSAFFVGYLATQILGGWLAHQYGGKLVLGYAVMLWSLFTFLTPLAAATSLYALLITRIGMGVGEGVAFPAIYSLYARWVPAQERATAVSLTGGAIPTGIAIALILAPWIAVRFGWAAIFYIFGALGLMWYALWRYEATDSPADHPRIAATELSLIRESTSPSAAKEPIPWKLLLSKKPVWAIIINHFCSDWGFYVILSWLPTYFHQALNIRLADIGPYAALPYVIMSVTMIVGGRIADGLLRNGFSVTFVRKLMQTAASIGPAVFLLVLSRGVHSPLHALVLMCCTLGFASLAYSGALVNHLDIGPRYAGVLLGLSNTAAQIPGIVGVTLTGFIIDATGSWSAVFLIAAAVYVFGAAVWLVAATGDRVFK